MPLPDWVPDGLTVNVNKMPSTAPLAQYTLKTYKEPLVIDLTEHPTATVLFLSRPVKVLNLEYATGA